MEHAPGLSQPAIDLGLTPTITATDFGTTSSPRAPLTLDTAFARSSQLEEVDLDEAVDWKTLNKLDAHQQQAEPLTVPIDNGYLRQRLERENSHDRGHSKQLSDSSAGSRRTSLQQIRRSVVETVSRLPTPTLTRKPQYGHSRNESKEILLTDLELWTALVSDYTQTAVRLPTLTTRKIHAGIPQPLRGLVWQAMSGAKDTHLEGLYDSLCVEKNTPFEKVIGRDLMRTFPQVEMFKLEGGEGQSDLGKVLRAFSLYDTEVGYCQGLGFIVAPLLMNMSHQEAFCVLVRIMEGYGMRSMFTSTLSGLKLRLYQFEQLFDANALTLSTFLKSIDVVPAMYLSQWFLSVFGVSCPLATLHRIYDLFLAEGAPETIMRLALALLIKNQEKLLKMDMEDVLHLLLSEQLWEVYDGDDDLLVSDTASLADRVTADGLVELEARYHAENEVRPLSLVPEPRGLQAVASSFLGKINPGRLFSASFSGPSGGDPSTAETDGEGAYSSSKASRMSATSSVSMNFKADLDQVEVSSNSSYSRDSAQSLKKHSESLERVNKQLNYQIEDMITALNDAHRNLANAQEDNDKVVASLDDFKVIGAELLDALASTEETARDALIAHWSTELSGKIEANPMSTAAQLSAEKIKFLEEQLDDRNHEVGRMRSSMTQAKTALEAYQKDRQRLEKSLNDIRLRKDKPQQSQEHGNRELKLARQGSSTNIPQSNESASGAASIIAGPMRAFRRVSAYSTATGTAGVTTSPTDSSISSGAVTPVQQPLVGVTPHEEELDALRLELVQAKASIAIYQQEADEAKYALKMSINANGAVPAQTIPGKGHVKRLSVNRAESAPADVEHPADTSAALAPATDTKSAPTNWFWKR